MTRFFLSEPGVLIAEQRPGPSFVDGCNARSARPAASVAELGAALAIEVAKSKELRAQMLADPTPTTTTSFGEMVASVMASENLSYGAAASKVSRERPDLYDEFRRAPNGRYDYNDPEDGPYA
jgi:hypothetical protein